MRLPSVSSGYDSFFFLAGGGIMFCNLNNLLESLPSVNPVRVQFKVSVGSKAIDDNDSGSKLHALQTLARDSSALEPREAFGVPSPESFRGWLYYHEPKRLPDTFNRA